MENGFETISVAYNGQEITKLELMLHLQKQITLYEKAHQGLEHVNKELEAKKAALNIEKKRRTLYQSTMEKPRGLAALSARNRQTYEQWLAEAPKRAQEKAAFEAEEDKRIAAVDEKLEELGKEQARCLSEALDYSAEYVDVCAQHIIPPDYREGDIPKILFLYLYNGRAHTLQDAINLYHQELHYQKLEDIAREQARQAKNDHYAQMQAMQEAARERAQALAAIQDDVAAARRSVENIEFTTDMMFWLSL